MSLHRPAHCVTGRVKCVMTCHVGEDSSQHLQVNGGVPALKKRTGMTGNNSLARSGKSGEHC